MAYTKSPMKPSVKIVSFKVEHHHQKALVPRTRDAPFFFPAYRQAGLLNFKIFQFLSGSFHSRIGIISCRLQHYGIS